MPVSVARLPTAAASAGGTAAVPTAWATPTNALADDNTNTTSSGTSLVGGTQILTVQTFNALAEQGGPIPAGASIVGVRVSYDLLATNGTLTYAGTAGGTAFTGSTYTGAQAIQTVGFGTLSAGSTLAAGNTFAGQDLSTDAGSAAARTLVGNLTATVVGGAGSGLNTASYGVDFVGFTIAYVIRVAGTGGMKAAPKHGGGLKATITAQGGGRSSSKNGGLPFTIVTGQGGARAAPKQGGQPRPAVTGQGGARAAAKHGGALKPLITPTGGARAGTRGAPAGPVTVVSYAISGVARDPNSDSGIDGVRVDVYRTSDHAWQGRVTSAGGGLYAIAIPYTGNESATFWARFRQAGSPTRLDTTDETLTLKPAIVQTA